MRTSAGVTEFLIISCVGVKASDDETDRGEEWRLPAPDCSSNGTSEERVSASGDAQYEPTQAAWPVGHVSTRGMVEEDASNDAVERGGKLDAEEGKLEKSVNLLVVLQALRPSPSS